MPTILVLDSDEKSLGNLGLLLKKEGFTPILTGDGIDGINKARTLRPQLILVDLQLSGISGFEVCKQLLADRIQAPLIVLSNNSEEANKVLLLECGVDDYLVKPFGTRELLARIKALLRRATPESTVFYFGRAIVDDNNRAVTYRGTEVNLTPKEYKLLIFFLRNPNRVWARDEILSEVWGLKSHQITRTVDMYVMRLRQKLEPESKVPRHFLTVHGVGYRFLH